MIADGDDLDGYALDDGERVYSTDGSEEGVFSTVGSNATVVHRFVTSEWESEAIDVASGESMWTLDGDRGARRRGRGGRVRQPGGLLGRRSGAVPVTARAVLAGFGGLPMVAGGFLRWRQAGAGSTLSGIEPIDICLTGRARAARSLPARRRHTSPADPGDLGASESGNARAGRVAVTGPLARTIAAR